jgi:hypothetical protein
MAIRRLRTTHALALALAAAACGSDESPTAPEPPAAPERSAPEAVRAPAPSAAPARPNLPRGIVLALAQFVTVDGKPQPGPARLEFLYRAGDGWHMTALEDAESNVFHKAMIYEGADGPGVLSLGGTAALLKLWSPRGGKLDATVLWQKDFGGKFSRMRDAEIADLFGDGAASIAVATHDQGVVAVLRPGSDGGYEVTELDAEPDTFVHEIEIGDLDGDGALEVYATPSEPNRLDGSEQSGAVVRYVPSRAEGRHVVADLGDRHAKEILVDDIDGDGRQELYVSVEGDVGPDKQLTAPVEIRRFEADTPAGDGAVIATLRDRLCRFLTAGDVDGDGRKELVAATFSQGLWLLRPGADPRGEWSAELIDRDSGGFEHAALLTDLDGDGRDELYVASDDRKKNASGRPEVRRYVWGETRPDREVIYVRPDDRPIFTWNLMPIPVALMPGL